MWVKRTGDEGAGNSELVSLGANWASDKITELDVAGLFESAKVKAPISDISSYDLFLAKAQYMCDDEPQTKDELVESMKINNNQFDVWIKQAVEEEELKKLTKPVRYQWDKQSSWL